jgi:hypothetical protein
MHGSVISPDELQSTVTALETLTLNVLCLVFGHRGRLFSRSSLALPLYARELNPRCGSRGEGIESAVAILANTMRAPLGNASMCLHACVRARVCVARSGRHPTREDVALAQVVRRPFGGFLALLRNQPAVYSAPYGNRVDGMNLEAAVEAPY